MATPYENESAVGWYVHTSTLLLQRTIAQAPNAALHLPRTQRIKHPSLAHESRAIRGQVQALVRCGTPRKASYVAELRQVFHQASPPI